MSDDVITTAFAEAIERAHRSALEDVLADSVVVRRFGLSSRKRSAEQRPIYATTPSTRFELLSLAVQAHAGRAASPKKIVETARVFEAYYAGPELTYPPESPAGTPDTSRTATSDAPLPTSPRAPD